MRTERKWSSAETGKGYTTKSSSDRTGWRRTSHYNREGLTEGPTPTICCFGSLGACTAMTLTMYAQRKGLPLRGITTRLQHSRIHADDCAECETEEGRIDSIELTIELDGPLSNEQRSKLLEIARKCPVHRTLTSEKVIEIGPGGESGWES